jgi:hypothetical protein
MWEEIEEYFHDFPAQGKVARLMLRAGLRVVGNKILCGDVELSDTALGRAAGVDRRVVKDTTKTINARRKLKEIFSKLQPTCNLTGVASILGWCVIEVIPKKADTPGILASISAMFADRRINIRQVIIEDDPAHADHPRGFIITEKPIPPDMLPKIKDVDGVEAVVLR